MYEGIVSECNVIYRMSRWGFRTNDQKIVKNKQHQAFRSFIRSCSRSVDVTKLHTFETCLGVYCDETIVS